MQRHRFLSILFFIAASLSLLVSAQELVFSGFVELASTAHADEVIDFSKVEIHLFTSDNNYAEKTHCSQNGFFLLPVYDKKSYIIKVQPPQESTFEPESIAIDLKGKTNEEVAKITEQSLSFKFIGFSLTGNVKIEGSDKGPAGVKVELYDSKGTKVSTTETQEGGQFRFDRVMTGKYKVKFENDNSGFYWNEGAGAINCELSWKNGQECSGSLVISSFEVQGKLSRHSQILNKHTIFLYSEDPTVRGKSTLPVVRDHPLSSNREYISYSKIGHDGTFRFERIPRGNYFLKIHSTDKDNKIEIEPDTYKLTVENKPANVDSPFTVKRFSIQGRVVDRDGNGLSGVKVILDGDKTAVSDAKGHYQLERVPIGKATLEANHEHLFFDVITDLQLDPSMTNLPDIVLSLVHVCGEVSLKGGLNDNEFENAKIVVYLEKQGEKRSSHIGKDDRYCFEVQPGRYNIYPVVLGAGSVQQDSLFSPKSREVQISNKPILDVNFYRPRLSIEGEVKLLQNVKSSQVEKTRVVLSSINKSFQKTATLDSSRRFKFEQVLPGTYDIHIENENICWKDENKRIDLSSSNLSNVVFEQVGFALKYQTTRSLEVRLTPPDGKPIDTQLLPSSNYYCVEKAGIYKIVPDICYQFSTQEFKVSTDDETPVVLEPVGFLIRGEVTVPEAIGQNLDNQTLSQFIIENIHVSLTTVNTNPPKRNVLRLQYSKTENGVLRFFYNYYVPANTEVVVEAKPKAKLEGKAELIIQNLMFNPSQVKLHVEDNCILDNANNIIEIRQGLIFVGSVQPPLSDWILTVTYENAPEGQNSLVETSQRTGPNFKLGPYLDIYKYNLAAEKEGYKFDPVLKEEGYNLYRVTFNAQKLSQLRILVLDEEKKTVPGALIFVSSMAKKDPLKINNYTNEKGVFSTHQLVKGEYFLKAVLKEYSFNPPQTTITIDDGEHKEITLSAKRVAYSAYGRVQTLGKAGCASLKITANPQDNLVPTETAETDADGSFRIKGLTPGHTYVVSVEGSSKYSNIRPEKITLQAQEKDFRNIDFIGFESKTTNTVSGTVFFDETYTEEEVDQIESIQVRIYQKGSTEPLDAATVKLFRYFEFKNLQTSDYTLKTLIKRGKNQLPSEYTHEISHSSFGQNHSVSANVEISKDRSKSGQDSSAHGSYMAPIVILIVIFIFLNMDTLLAKYRKYVENKEQQPNANKKRN